MEKLYDTFPFLKSLTQTRAYLFLAFVVRRFETDHCREKAASLTYTTMLSIVPIITVILVSLSSIPALSKVKEQIQSLIYQNLLPQTGFQLSQYLNEFAEKSSNLTAIGVFILFITTLMMIVKIEDAFNRIWRVHDVRDGFFGFTRYWVLITLGPLVLGVVFVASSAITSISFLNHQVAGYAVDWGAWLQIITFALSIFGFAAIYWFVPNTHVPFKNALMAGMVTGVLFDVLKSVYGTVMANFTSYELIYGAFAALPVFLLWVYLSWCLILAGVEISYAINVFETREVKKRHPIFILLDVLHLLHEKQKQGRVATETELKAELGRAELANWHDYKRILENKGLIAKTDHEGYVLKQNLSHLSFWQFYQSIPYALPHGDELNLIDHDAPWRDSLGTLLGDCDDYLANRFSVSLAEAFDGVKCNDKSC